MSTISFTVSGSIVPWARAGRSKSGLSFTPKKNRDYAAAVRHAAAQAMDGRPPIEEPVELRVTATYLLPQSRPKWQHKLAALGRLFHANLPDVDNIAKTAQDAMNQIVYRDDRQIHTLVSCKRWGDVAGLTVEVIPTPQPTKPEAAL